MEARPRARLKGFQTAPLVIDTLAVPSEHHRAEREKVAMFTWRSGERSGAGFVGDVSDHTEST